MIRKALKINIKTMDKKTKEVLLDIIRDHGDATVTVIMKTCYLIDLTAQKRLKQPITNLQYIRYNYGPFDSNIYRYLLRLIEADLVTTDTKYFSVGGNEVVTYKLKDISKTFETDLKQGEKEIVDEVLSSIRGLGARMLTEIAYQTAPMKKIGAKIGNNEGLGKKLDLKVR